MFKCQQGLAFDIVSELCTWPGEADGCDAEAFLKFTCPKGDDRNFNDSYEKKDNVCEEYFICENDKPKLLKCGGKNAFNPETGLCEREYYDALECPHK